MQPPATLATTQMTTDNVIESSPWNLRKVQGQIRNCDMSVITHSFVDLTHQITKDGHQLCASSCTFSHSSSNIWTYFLTMPLLIALSPYTWQIKSHRLRSGEYGGFGTTGKPFLAKTSFSEMSVCREHSCDTASKCPHAQFFGQNVDGLVIQIQLTIDHCDCHMLIRPHIFFCFWCARSSRTRFIFYNLMAIQNALCQLKTCALNRACSP
jgi:hypothetical protein